VDKPVQFCEKLSKTRKKMKKLNKNVDKLYTFTISKRAKILWICG
jgi:hypothetical protein